MYCKQHKRYLEKQTTLIKEGKKVSKEQKEQLLRDIMELKDEQRDFITGVAVGIMQANAKYSDKEAMENG